MRIAEFCRDVESEVVRPVQLFVAQLYDLAVTLLDDSLGEHGLNGRIQLFEHVLLDNVQRVVLLDQ